MRKLLAAAFLSFSMLACKPPVTELQIPLASTMQGKGYQEIVPMTEIKVSAGSETITAYLVTPEMILLGAEEKLKAEGKLDELKVQEALILKTDNVLCQLSLLAVSKENADPNKWTYKLTDDTGKTMVGKVDGVQGDPKKIPGSSGGVNFTQSGQVKFEGYKIGTAKKISIQFTHPGGKASTLTWILASDHKVVEPSSQPASTPAK
jgi:hypothetical protein